MIERCNCGGTIKRYLYAAFSLTPRSVIGDHLGQVYEAQHKTKDAIHMYQTALAAVPLNLQAGPDLSQIKERLTHLGSKSLPFNASSEEINNLRTFKLPRLVEGEANAEFFLLFSPQAKSPGFKLGNVRFISGSEKLRSAGKDLNTINYKVRFPDDGPAHIIRRGMLGCYKYTGCSIVLLAPETVQSIN